MLLKLEKISKSYSKDRIILDQLDMKIDAGERIAILGPSGSGKTTLLNLIGTLDRPDFGMIAFENQDLSKLNDQELAVFRNRKIGFVFQMHHLLPQLSLWENVLLPSLASHELQGKNAEDRARKLIDRVGLSMVIRQKPSELSGGECQRTAGDRALLNRPAILLDDEPTGEIDHKSSGNLTDLLVELNKEEGVALVMVTHSIEVARKMDRIYQLDDGKLIEMM